MTNQEAMEWQKAFKRTYNGTPCDAAEACDMAIEALKKRPAYLRLIKKYQTRQKNQTAELHNLQKQNDRLKAELEALKPAMKKNEHDPNVKCKINGQTCIDCQPCCGSRGEEV